jgi:hypothetical protein
MARSPGERNDPGDARGEQAPRFAEFIIGRMAGYGNFLKPALPARRSRAGTRSACELVGCAAEIS